MRFPPFRPARTKTASCGPPVSAAGLSGGARSEATSRSNLPPHNGRHVEVTDQRDHRDDDADADIGIPSDFKRVVVTEHERRRNGPPTEDPDKVIEVGGGSRAQRRPQ